VNSRFDVAIHTRNDDLEWTRFLQISRNATLFHELEFLAYHPGGRFSFEHLIVRQDDRIVAAVPGGQASDGIYRSPLGASFGGPALRADLSLSATEELIGALQGFAEKRGWRGLEFTLPPSVIHDPVDESLEGALALRGFELKHRWVPMMIPLTQTVGGDRFEDLFDPRKRRYVRSARRAGDIAIEVGGAELIDEFSPMLDDAAARFGLRPTHSRAEILDLLNRMGGRITLWLARYRSEPVAGVLLFIINKKVATVFYLRDYAATRGHHGSETLVAHLIDVLAAEGFQYLDMGPSAETGRINGGVVAFKEHLGARGFCRDQYLWVARS
jgi:hypothetical protein